MIPWSRLRQARHWIWFGLACLALGLAASITHDLLENEVLAIDQAILLAVTGWRTPWLNVAAVDITALGSVTVASLLTLGGTLLCLAAGRPLAALQLLIAVIGGGLLSIVLKWIFGRPRPDLAPRLVDIGGFSYPSGHAVLAASLFATLAILATLGIRRRHTRLVLAALAGLLIFLVGLSRVYLGVHYPSDVVSGFGLGLGWAFLLAGLFTRLTAEAERPSRRRVDRDQAA